METENKPDMEMEAAPVNEASTGEMEGVLEEFRGKGQPSHTERMMEMLEEEKKKTEKGYGSSPVSWRDNEGTK